MRTHLKFAHELWAGLLKPDDTAIDASCGNGRDTLQLARLLPQGVVFALDIQKIAIEKTKARGIQGNIFFFEQSHETFPKEAYQRPVKLIIYNLGYLPGGDRSLTTQTKTSLKSLEKACHLIIKDGAISMMLYPGHEEGGKEKEALLSYAGLLPKQEWEVNHYSWSFLSSAPSLLFLKKRL